MFFSFYEFCKNLINKMYVPKRIAGPILEKEVSILVHD